MQYCSYIRSRCVLSFSSKRKSREKNKQTASESESETGTNGGRQFMLCCFGGSSEVMEIRNLRIFSGRITTRRRTDISRGWCHGGVRCESCYLWG